MALDQRLLEILRCPATGQTLVRLACHQLDALNQGIADGTLYRDDGDPVTATLTAALITADGARVYRIEDGIPVMLAPEAIKPGKLIAPAD